MITENILLDNFDPAFRSLNSTHLDSGKGIVQLLSNRTHCLHTAWEADFFSVVYNLSYRRDNGGSSAQTAFCEFRYFFKEDFSFFYFHSQVFLSYIFQRAAGDRRQDTVGFWCYQLVVLGDEDKVGAAGFFYFCRSEEHTSELQSRFDLVCRL